MPRTGKRRRWCEALSTSQGQSGYTKTKEGVFATVFGWWFSRLQEPRRFTVIDMNSGCGMNGRTRGTPLIIHDSAKRWGVDLAPHYIDISPSAVRSLQRQPEFAPRLPGILDPVAANFYRGDNARVLPELDPKIPSHTEGALVCDPNGCSGREFPLKEVAMFLRNHQRFHLVLHLSGVERTNGAARKSHATRETYERNGTIYSASQLRVLRIQPRLIHRFANGHGPPHLVLVFSRRWIPDRRDIGLLRTESTQGMEVLRRYEVS